MTKILIVDRYSKKIEEEKVYGKNALIFLYGNNFFSKFFLKIFSRLLIFSKVYGYLQKKKFSKKKIVPFIKNFKINTAEFEKKTVEFTSFNDFFIRKLKKNKRTITTDKNKAILPADSRCLVFSDIKKIDGFYVKDKKFDLLSFLQDDFLVKKYESAAMLIARLCPSDYHRFHFPIDCKAKKSKLINGYLYSVNPLALKKNIDIFCENKRVITLLESEIFGDILFVEIGATNVGSINQTFKENTFYKKGDEKGYFSLGGSSIVLLFEKNKIIFDEDLINNSKQRIETKVLFGQSLGKSFI